MSDDPLEHLRNREEIDAWTTETFARLLLLDANEHWHLEPMMVILLIREICYSAPIEILTPASLRAQELYTEFMASQESE